MQQGRQLAAVHRGGRHKSHHVSIPLLDELHGHSHLLSMAGREDAVSGQIGG